MRAFRTLWIDSMKMLLRNRVLIVTSLGVGLISIFVFGWLFGNGNFTLHLGVVNEDGSAVSAQMVQQLKQNASLHVSTGSDAGEMAALRAGNRDAVLILQPGFGASLQHGGAQLQVYYDQSNPTTLTATRGAVEGIVDNINASVAGRTPPITIAEQAVSVHNLRQIDFITPGMLGMMLMWTNLAVGTILVTWRQQGIMKRLAATPLPPGTLIATQMLARLGLSLAQAAVLIGVAMAVFHVQVVGNWLVLGLVVALGALAMLGLGGVVGSFARTPDESQSIFFLISFPMMFLGGSYFSTTDAPSFLQPVVNFLPLTHLNDALRQIINNGASLASVQTDLLILAAWMIATVLLSARAFRWS
jgi:ABC-2 type transport system permease protein